MVDKCDSNNRLTAVLSGTKSTRVKCGHDLNIRNCAKCITLCSYVRVPMRAYAYEVCTYNYKRRDSVAINANLWFLFFFYIFPLPF